MFKWSKECTKICQFRTKTFPMILIPLMTLFQAFKNRLRWRSQILKTSKVHFYPTQYLQIPNARHIKPKFQHRLHLRRPKMKVKVLIFLSEASKIFLDFKITKAQKMWFQRIYCLAKSTSYKVFMWWRKILLCSNLKKTLIKQKTSQSLIWIPIDQTSGYNLENKTTTYQTRTIYKENK